MWLLNGLAEFRTIREDLSDPTHNRGWNNVVPQQWPRFKGEKQDWDNIYRLFIKHQHEDISFKPFLSWKGGESCLLKDIPHPLYECASFSKKHFCHEARQYLTIIGNYKWWNMICPSAAVAAPLACSAIQHSQTGKPTINCSKHTILVVRDAA